MEAQSTLHIGSNEWMGGEIENKLSLAASETDLGKMPSIVATVLCLQVHSATPIYDCGIIIKSLSVLKSRIKIKVDGLTS